MDHAAFRRLAAGAVLEDLDRDEAVAFAVHAAGCRPCGALADELQATAADLALAAVPRRPPASLETGIVRAIRALERPADADRPLGVPGAADRPLGAPTEPSASATPAHAPIVRIDSLAHRARRLRPASVAAVGLAACLLVATVGLGAYAAALDGRLALAEAAVRQASLESATQAGAMSVALDPRHASASLHAEPLAPAAVATVVYRPGSTDAYLVVGDLPAPPAGHVYQLWVADAAGAHALGTFASDGSHPVVVPFGMDLGGKAAAMVTLEPTGGSTGSPGPQVVFGELDARS